MATPLVSICLPNLNTRPFLEERMESILHQTLGNWELVVGDSYSDDGSWDFFQKFKSDPRVKLHQIPREGIYAGWNECLRRATGEFIYIATSDDTASPNLLARLAAPLLRFPEISIAVCDYQEIDEDSKPLQTQSNKSGKRAFLGEWLSVPSIRSGSTEFLLHATMGTIWHTMTAVLFRRSLLERVGYFRTDRVSQADYEWTLRASLASDIAFVPGQLATWRWREGQGTPHERSREFVGRDLEMLEAVVNDPQSGIPQEWKRVNGWNERITSCLRAEYHHKFMLYRGLAKTDPPRLVKNIWMALLHEPVLLMRRAARGFAWSKDCRPDGARVARELIELFGAPWPPQRITE